MKKTLLTIKNLNISFNGNNIVNNFNLELYKGEKVAIKGLSGKGKTTILQSVLGFIPTT